MEDADENTEEPVLGTISVAIGQLVRKTDGTVELWIVDMVECFHRASDIAEEIHSDIANGEMESPEYHPVNISSPVSGEDIDAICHTVERRSSFTLRITTRRHTVRSLDS